MMAAATTGDSSAMSDCERLMVSHLIDGRSTGLLLVGHGTRDAAGLAELFKTARLVRRLLPGVPAELGFLELAEPTIDEAVARLAAAEVRRLVAMPLLLFAAGHAKRDIPAAVAVAVGRYPNLMVEHAGHLGCHESIVELSARRFDESLDGQPPLPTAETFLLLVGRGSRDPDATAEMNRFVRLRVARTPVGLAENCFLAMAEPSLEEMLPRVAATGYPRVVVQPHLLFAGQLLTRLQDAVSTFASGRPNQQWLITGHLGAEQLVAEAIVDRCRCTLRATD